MFGLLEIQLHIQGVELPLQVSFRLLQLADQSVRFFGVRCEFEASLNLALNFKGVLLELCQLLH